jgi:hypothetical protein
VICNHVQCLFCYDGNDQSIRDEVTSNRVRQETQPPKKITGLHKGHLKLDPLGAGNLCPVDRSVLS